MPYPRAKPPAGGIKANYRGFIEPALATSIDKVPAGERWIHEIKFDGYRVQVHLRDAAVKVFTRRGNDWTNRSERSRPTRGTSMPDRRSSMARWWSRQIDHRRGCSGRVTGLACRVGVDVAALARPGGFLHARKHHALAGIGGLLVGPDIPAAVLLRQPSSVRLRCLAAN